MEIQWLTYAKRLQAIASTGLHYCRDDFDRERFAEIRTIAGEMMAALGSVSIERIDALVSDFAKGYATPKVDVRGAVIEDGAVLLVRERSDGLWTLPGGFADVGLSAARNIEKEMLEEAGLRVRASRLYAVRHKASHSYAADVRDFYKLFFLCERTHGDAPQAGLETSETDFFRPDALPPLSRGRVLEADIHAAFAHATDALRPTVFD